MNEKKKRSLADDNLLQSLKKSHALLNGIVESSKEVVIFALDRQYRYVAFNRIHHQTMRQIWGVDIALGNNMLEYIKSPEDRLKAKNNFDRALSGESFVQMEEYGDEVISRRYYLDHYNPTIDEDGDIIGLNLFLIDITEQKRLEKERENIIKELQNALAELKTLRGILPLCSFCKKIRNDSGYWEQVDEYIARHSEADISHSICPECLKKHYPKQYEAIMKKGKI
jgi:PAS domain S-box-containing protein